LNYREIKEKLLTKSLADIFYIKRKQQLDKTQHL